MKKLLKSLPTLQRYGMNYFLPLSNPSALKPITATAPFLSTGAKSMLMMVLEQKLILNKQLKLLP